MRDSSAQALGAVTPARAAATPDGLPAGQEIVISPTLGPRAGRLLTRCRDPVKPKQDGGVRVECVAGERLVGQRHVHRPDE